MGLTKSLNAFYRGSSLFRRTHPRRAHVYCVGTGKTGTHSVAGLFGKCLRASHEPEPAFMIGLAIGLAENRIAREEAARLLRVRDERLWLEVDSSHLNTHVVDLLAEEFPQARFVLLIRDCYSWVNSLFNDTLGRHAGPHWQRYREFFRGEPTEHPRAELVLKEHGLGTLDLYLSRWSERNRKVVQSVPRERLLVVRTNEIRTDVRRLAGFVGVAEASLDLSQVHAYAARSNYDLLRKIDPDHLASRVDAHCRDLMDEYFPEIKSPEDAPGAARP